MIRTLKLNFTSRTNKYLRNLCSKMNLKTTFKIYETTFKIYDQTNIYL